MYGFFWEYLPFGRLWLDRLLIDRRFQGRGYGRAALAALLDQSYWVVGSVIGSLLGAALGFDTTGVDFAMTALFLVIAVGQWKTAGSHLPALLGGAATLVSLMAVGAEEMLLPALGIMVAALVLLRPTLEERERRRAAAVREEGAR